MPAKELVHGTAVVATPVQTLWARVELVIAGGDVNVTTDVAVALEQNPSE